MCQGWCRQSLAARQHLYSGTHEVNLRACQAATLGVLRQDNNTM